MLLARLAWHLRLLSRWVTPWLPVIVSAAWDRAVWVLLAAVTLAAVTTKITSKAQASERRINFLVQNHAALANTVSTLSGTVTTNAAAVSTLASQLGSAYFSPELGGIGGMPLSPSLGTTPGGANAVWYGNVAAAINDTATALNTLYAEFQARNVIA